MSKMYTPVPRGWMSTSDYNEMLNKSAFPSDSVKSASPPPPPPPAETIDLDSDATIVEVLETSTPPSPSLLLDIPKPVTPLKRSLDEADQDYAINTFKPQTPRMRVARLNIKYLQNFYDMDNQKELFEELLTYTYESITFNVHGLAFTPRRKVLAFADPGVSYNFSGVSLQPKPWTFLMQCIKDKVQREFKCTFNHALLNFYPDGKAKLCQHKDNENCVDASVPVVTVSFGAQRNMEFTKKGEKPYIQPLHPGSVLVMYKQYWSHGITPDFSCKEPRISISFRKILVPDTVQPPATAKLPTPEDRVSEISSEAFLKFASLGPAQDMADPGFLESFPDAQPLLPEKPVDPTECVLESPPPKKACLDIPEDDWLTRHCQGIAEPIDTCNLPERMDIKKFWLSDTVALSLQLSQGELFVHLREYSLHPNDHYEMLPTCQGTVLNLHTFYQFCNKLGTFSKTLVHTDESCILNNCVMLIVEDQQLYIRQFNNEMLHPSQVVLNVQEFLCLYNQLDTIISFVLDFQFNTHLKSKVCLPICKLPYMDTSFLTLKNLVREDLKYAVAHVFRCAECVTGCQPTMYRHQCRRFSYAEKYFTLPKYCVLMVDIERVVTEFLSFNSKLNFKDFDFNLLYKNLF